LPMIQPEFTSLIKWLSSGWNIY